MKYLLFFLISFNCFADYATKKGILDCKNKGSYTTYSSKKRCLKFSGKSNCYELLQNFNCDYIKYDEVKKEWGIDIVRKSAYDAKNLVLANLKIKKNNAKNYLKTLDCETYVDDEFRKNICYIMK